MENEDIAGIFNEIADILEIKGENPFRVRSYRNAALVVEGLAVSLNSVPEGDLEKIPAVGKSIHEKIVEMLRTGRCAAHDELLRETPEGLLEMLKLSGVGPKKVALLYKKLGIESVEALEEAARAGALRTLPGMGEKSELKIIKAIEKYKNLMEGSDRFPLVVALAYAHSYVDYIKGLDGVIEAEPAGSLRRWQETIGDVDILVTCQKGVPVMDRFVAYPEVEEVAAKGETRSTVILKNGLQVDLRVMEEECLGSARQHFTGSKAHNIAVRERAGRMGLKVNEYGVFNEKTGERVAGRTEEEVYEAVGLKWMPPELRENRGEIEAAERGKKLPHLVELKDIKGDLHAHTTASDGASTIEELARAAMAMGYEYIAVTDHSKAVGIANGLDEKRLLRQIGEIDAFNEKLEERGERFRVLKGTEVDIKADGTLDFPEDVLKKLDCVVGAVHSGFDMEREVMTERIIKGMSTGSLNILAHPTGRLIGIREPYELDIERVVAAAAEYGVAL
ncbi:MAG: DNA polymerase/3'-5' exonuclease PolX, partial [Thermodesulfobacteriota bacterium]